MNIVTRSAWNARKPLSVMKVAWSRRTGFMVHYSGADKDQTVRSIQDHCMDTRGFSDIDYNFLVRDDGTIYEGRGWDNRGSHCLDENTPNIGVCAIGLDKDITAAQMHSIRWLYEGANRRKGSQLVKRTHGGTTHKTDCPGKRLQAWVDAGMPDPSAPSHPVYGNKVLSRSSVYNPAVKVWQQRMSDRFWSIKVDGLFGLQTEEKVRAFQKEKGLTATGKINKATWDKAWTAPVTR